MACCSPTLASRPSAASTSKSSRRVRRAEVPRSPGPYLLGHVRAASRKVLGATTPPRPSWGFSPSKAPGLPGALLGPPLTPKGNSAAGSHPLPDLDRVRFHVWGGAAFQPVSEEEEEQIRAHLRAGRTAFTVSDGLHTWRIETESGAGWVQVCTWSGKRRRMKLVEEIPEEPPSCRGPDVACERRPGDGERLPHSSRAPPGGPRVAGSRPSRRPCFFGRGQGVLESLRKEWALLADGLEHVSKSRLSRAWRTATLAAGPPGDETLPPPKPGTGDDLLTQATEDLFNRVDLSRNGKIEQEEWVHYRLLEMQAPSFAAVAEVNEVLLAWLAAERSVLRRLLSLFERLLLEAESRDAKIRARQMRRAAEEWLETGPRGGTLAVRSIEHLSRLLDSNSGLLDEHEVVNYYEYINHMLGRERTQVVMYQYDLSKGRAAWLSPLLLGRAVDGIWHTSVVVHGKEYWFGGKVLESPPGRTQFGQPTRVLELGTTLRTREELLTFIRRELLDEFTVNSYDVLTRNCNHFSEEVCRFLTNRHIPEEVLKQPEMVMQTVAAQAARPLLNWWLGRCGAAACRPSGHAAAAAAVQKERQRGPGVDGWSSVVAGTLVAYEYEPGWIYIARVCRKGETDCDLQWYDARLGRLQLQTSVDRSTIHALQPFDEGGRTKHRPGGGGIFGPCYHPVMAL